jgi:glycine/D-amino acid oxidase-like deaminating enzyme
MKTYDWIVVGGGLAGSAIAYELAHAGHSVLLLEQNATPANATRYSYGGIAYWSGSTPLLQQLCQEGIDIHRQLSAELDSDTEFRELDLLLTIQPDRDPKAIAAHYNHCLVPPQLIDRDTAAAIEPLLDPHAIAAALHTRHAQVSPLAIVRAYQQAMLRQGGEIQFEQVSGFEQTGTRVTGVTTANAAYAAGQVVVAAGALSRRLLHHAGLSSRLYFTQAELIETAPIEMQLQAIVMPAELKRFAMEAAAGSADVDERWNQPGQEVVAPVLDAGAVQLRDRSLRIGQISRALTDPNAAVDAAQSEAEMRTQIGTLLPALKDVPGQWCTCLVAFSGDGLPLVGAVPGVSNLHLFSGFSNPFALLPPLARRFARQAGSDRLLAQLSLDRFGEALLNR